MSDYNSSLPVRTEAAGDIDIFISDATVSTQKLKVNADGSIDVNASATDLDIRDLSASQDNVAISDGTDQLEVNADGSINVVATATDLDIRDLAFATDKVDVSNSTNVGVVGTDFDIRDLSATQDSISISDGTDSLEVNADGSLNVVASATDLDIRDLSAASDSVAAHLFDEAGVAFSASNPLPVSIASDQEGDEVLDYQTSAAVAKDASVNHDYTVTAGKTFLGEEAWISGSGKLKVELLVNGSTVFVGFNSTANPNVRIPLEKIMKANAAEVIRFTITNRDNQAQDLYSTLLGLEV